MHAQQHISSLAVNSGLESPCAPDRFLSASEPKLGLFEFVNHVRHILDDVIAIRHTDLVSNDGVCADMHYWYNL